MGDNIEVHSLLSIMIEREGIKKSEETVALLERIDHYYRRANQAIDQVNALRRENDALRERVVLQKLEIERLEKRPVTGRIPMVKGDIESVSSSSSCSSCHKTPTSALLAVCHRCGKPVCGDCLVVERVGDEYRDACPECVKGIKPAEKIRYGGVARASPPSELAEVARVLGTIGAVAASPLVITASIAYFEVTWPYMAIVVWLAVGWLPSRLMKHYFDTQYASVGGYGAGGEIMAVLLALCGPIGAMGTLIPWLDMTSDCKKGWKW